MAIFFFFFQVYKTQLERVSEGWTNKMSNFERLNTTLRSSLSELQSENNELKTLVSTDYLYTVSSPPINPRLFILLFQVHGTYTIKGRGIIGFY